jgi:hypothetical protein
MTNTTTTAFDPNVCIGYLVEEHAHPVEDLGSDWLCPSCSRRLNGEVAASRRAARMETASTCSRGHTQYDMPMPIRDCCWLRFCD